MNHEIDIYVDEKISGYIMRLPELTTMEMLIKAKSDFENLLIKNDHINKFSLLLDTGKHEFESVAPENYTPAEFKSDKEATFNDFAQAYMWLSKS